jgi:formylmethanofuran dehydrogenase subunit E
MAKKGKSKIKVGVSCQCQDPAVARPSSHLMKVQCKKCGLIFRTNRDRNSEGYDLCFKCMNKR